MNARINRLLRNIVSLALVAGLLYYLYANWGVFQASEDVSWWHIGVLCGCVLATWVLNSIQAQMLLRMEQVSVGFWENLSIQTATILGNYLPMRAGTILRFHYFKKIHGLEYSRLGGIVALRLVILVAATGLLGCIGLGGLQLSDRPGVELLWLVFGGMFAVPLLAWWLPYRVMRLPDNRIGRLAKKFLSGFVNIKSQPRLAVIVLLLLLCQFAILSVRLFVSFDAIQVQLSPWVLLLLAPVATLSSFLTITPGNLALREWIIGFLSLVAGYPFDIGVFASTLDRAVMMVCTFFFGTVSVVWIWLRLRVIDIS